MRQQLWLGRQGTLSLAAPSPTVNGSQGPFGPKPFLWISIVLDFFIKLNFAIGYLKIIVVWSR
jgi:hypothetical protein